MQSILYDTSDSLLRVIVSAPLLYFAVIVFIRVSGKRTTSKMNSFDWIVTVAMGSLVASGVILQDTHIVEVLLAIGLLIVLQYIMTKGIAHSDVFARLVKSTPVLLLYNGEMLPGPMKRERISEAEILAAVRAHGSSTLKKVRAITLESDATLTVLLHDASTDKDMSAYHNVEGWPEA